MPHLKIGLITSWIYKLWNSILQERNLRFREMKALPESLWWVSGFTSKQSMLNKGPRSHHGSPASMLMIKALLKAPYFLAPQSALVWRARASSLTAILAELAPRKGRWLPPFTHFFWATTTHNSFYSKLSGEMAQWLGVLTAPPEDLSLVPSTHIKLLTASVWLPLQGIGYTWPLSVPVLLCT